MSEADYSIHELSFSDKLRLLSVRIMDETKVVKGSGILYVVREHGFAYALTAGHVVSGGKTVFVECQRDKGDEKNPDADKYLFEVFCDDIAVDPEYVHNIDPTISKDEKRKFDAAVIPLKLDPVKHSWMESREEAYFLSEGMDLKGQHVTGFGYPKYKQLRGYGIDSTCAELDPQKARCSQYTAAKNILTWKLELDVTNYEEKVEEGGWSGSILTLGRKDAIILAGIVLERYPNGEGRETLGADMHRIRLLLEEELRKNGGNDIKVREFAGAVESFAETVSGRPCDRLVPTPPASSFFIEGSHADFIEKMGGIAARNKPIVLYGPAGCGKTELARAIAENLAIDKISYTIRFCPSKSEKEWDMQASILATEAITGKAFDEESQELRDAEFDRRLEILSTRDEGGKTIRAPRWIIIDDFYHPQKKFTDLLRDPSFNRLRGLGNYLICTTRYNPDPGDRNFEVPPLFNTWSRHRRELWTRMCDQSGAKICKRHFKKCYSLTGGNLLLADWTRKTLVCCVDMKDILKAMKTGDFPAKEPFPDIEDERSGSHESLEKHIQELYNIDSLDPAARNVLALLQFVGRGVWSGKHFFQYWDKTRRDCIVDLWKNGWCVIKEQKISIDPALKLTCRVRKLTPDQGELKELLEKMHSDYVDPQNKTHELAIRAYYKAAKKAVPTLFDSDMLSWHREICCVRGGW